MSLDTSTAMSRAWHISRDLQGRVEADRSTGLTPRDAAGQAVSRSSSATVSTCGVWGNMSTGFARRSSYP